MWGWRDQPAWDDDAIALWGEVRQRSRTSTPPRRAHLRRGHGLRALPQAGRRREAAELAEEALREVRLATADPEARLRVLRCAMSALLRPDLVARRLALYDEVIELAAARDEPTSPALVLTTRASDRAALGRLDRGPLRRAARRRASPSAAGCPQNLMVTGWCRAHRCTRSTGDWEGPSSGSRPRGVPGHALDLGRRHRPSPSVATLRELQGRLAEMMSRWAPRRTTRSSASSTPCPWSRPAGSTRLRLLLGPWREQPPLSPRLRAGSGRRAAVARCGRPSATSRRSPTCGTTSRRTPTAGVGSIAVDLPGQRPARRWGSWPPPAGDREAAADHLARALAAPRASSGSTSGSRRTQARWTRRRPEAVRASRCRRPSARGWRYARRPAAAPATRTGGRAPRPA